jgi:hypothetical protein
VGGYRNAPVAAPGFDRLLPRIPGEPPALSGDLLVDTATLATAVDTAGEAVDEADRAVQRVDGALGRGGPIPWGDDPGLGDSFGSVFADPRHALAEAVETLPAVLRGLVEDLRRVSQAFTDVEAEATARGRELGGQLRRTRDW